MSRALMVIMVVRETLLRRRVTTRLSWLGVTQTDFARVIGVDKASFSRVMALSPRDGAMVERIAMGLGISLEDLVDESNRQVLLQDHPALSDDLDRAARIAVMTTWYEQHHVAKPPRYRRSDEERRQRRVAVQGLMNEGKFCPDTVREIALKFNVSSSQIYADRTFLKGLQGSARSPDA